MGKAWQFILVLVVVGGFLGIGHAALDTGNGSASDHGRA
jgi:hypothetical protein